VPWHFTPLITPSSATDRMEDQKIPVLSSGILRMRSKVRSVIALRPCSRRANGYRVHSARKMFHGTERGMKRVSDFLSGISVGRLRSARLNSIRLGWLAVIAGSIHINPIVPFLLFTFLFSYFLICFFPLSSYHICIFHICMFSQMQLI
jgi:hypothetical protein